LRRPEAALAAALLLALGAPAVDGPRAARWHFVFGGLLGKDFELSVLFTRTERGDDTRLLVSASAGRFVFLSRQDPTGRDSTESIQAMPAGELFERRLLLSGYGGVAGCGAVKAPDACLVWSGANGSFSSGLSAFSGEGAKAAREKVAALATEPMRKSLFALAPILPALMEFGSYKGDFLGLVWPSRFDAVQSLRRGKRTAGCDFDATFGHPCNEAEKERERKRFDEP
jgi:hypothetical protein